MHRGLSALLAWRPRPEACAKLAQSLEVRVSSTKWRARISAADSDEWSTGGLVNKAAQALEKRPCRSPSWPLVSTVWRGCLRRWAVLSYVFWFLHRRQKLFVGDLPKLQCFGGRPHHSGQRTAERTCAHEDVFRVLSVRSEVCRWWWTLDTVEPAASSAAPFLDEDDTGAGWTDVELAANHFSTTAPWRLPQLCL